MIGSLLTGQVSSLAAVASARAGEAARRAALRIVMLAIAGLAAMAGIGFLAAAAYIALAERLGGAVAAAIIGLVLVLLALILFWLSGRRPRRSIAATYPAAPAAGLTAGPVPGAPPGAAPGAVPGTASSVELFGSIAAAFAAGLGAAAIFRRK